MRKFLLSLIFMAAGAWSVLAQGVTTSSISGTVTDKNGGALPGATVLAIHVPSGSQYGTTTRADGRFNILNAQVGGPYRIAFTFVGYEENKLENVYLQLGRNFNTNITLSESATTLEAVEISGTQDAVFNPERTGTATSINERQIMSMPTVSRSLADFTRMTPQAIVTPNGGISIAGANNRYNSIFIDGAVNNDVFGLSETGTNGGQANSISPISVDAIEEFQVVLAPFDVRLGGFAGGGINAVTRSGSNTFSGSVYTFYRNQTLAGKTPTDNTAVERKKLDDFTAQTTGFRVGGRIIKDKLFFFVNAEIQRDKTPQPFDLANYTGAVTGNDLTTLTNFLRSEYSYDPGGYLDNTAETKSDKFLIRLDYNINANHKLTVRHSYTKGEAYKRSRSSNSTINFANNSEFFPSTTNSSAIELKSNFGNTMSNNLIIGYTNVLDDRGSIGQDFPRVTIRDGSNNIIFGTEPFSSVNQLKSKIFTITDNFTIYKGSHVLTFGTHNEYGSFYNAFIGNNYGAYTFANLASFLNKGNSTDYERSYSLVDAVSGDGTKAAADFNTLQIGLYGQDEFSIGPKLNITAGLRIDVPMYLGDPEEDPYFNNTVIPKIEAAGYDLEGARVGDMPDPKLMFSPRIGFNYDITGNRATQLRGGVGIFTSRIPYVWPGASYNNNGVLVGAIPGGANPNVPFRPDPFGQYTGPDVGAAVAVPSGDINVFTKDFKFPQIFRATLAVDQKLPWGMIGTLEAVYTKTLNNITYEQYNVKKPTLFLAGQDKRPRYDRNGPALVDNTYRHILIGKNTNEGNGYNFTAQLQKPFSNGFTSNVSYTFGRSKVLNEGTSSQNSSQWRFIENVRGKNDLDVTYSDFDLGSRIVAAISYRKEYLNHFATTISLFYNGQSGQRISYIYANSLSNDDPQATNTGADLIYVPRSYDTYAQALAAGEIRLVNIVNTDGSIAATPDQQWNDLNSFISGDEYLNSRRGGYAERNGSRLPFTNVVDLRLLQDFFVTTGKTRHTLQLSLDIFNFTNMLNKDWGRQYFVTNDAYQIIEYVSLGADNIPNFRFRKPASVKTIDDGGVVSSRWQAQVGVRYSF
jgi:outer membrane receptor for ferrienterochelin and colicin